jgi:hypothetical protein
MTNGSRIWLFVLVIWTISRAIWLMILNVFVGRMAPAPVKSDGRSSCLQEKGYMGVAAGCS